MSFREKWELELLPYYLSIGISKEEILESDPKDLEAYELAHKIVMNRRNTELYRLGMYIGDAINATVGNMFGGKNKYPEEPYRIFPMTEQEQEEEKEKQLHQLLKFFGAMEKNFKE